MNKAILADLIQKTPNVAINMGSRNDASQCWRYRGKKGLSMPTSGRDFKSRMIWSQRKICGKSSENPRVQTRKSNENICWPLSKNSMIALGCVVQVLYLFRMMSSRSPSKAGENGFRVADTANIHPPSHASVQ
jgi:hypothetical protein